MMNDMLSHITSDSTLLEQAAKAVLRDALDDVRTHPCDEGDDAVAVRSLSPQLRALFSALMEQAGRPN